MPRVRLPSLSLPKTHPQGNSCSFPHVAMVQATDFRQLNHLSQFRTLDGSRFRGVSFQRQVTAGTMVVLKVTAQDATQVPLIQHDDMVQAFSPDGTNQPFDVGILPRRSRSREHFLYAQALDTMTKVFPIDAVSIPQQIARSAVVGKSLHGLLCGPLRAGTGGDIEMQNASPVMRED